MASDYKKIAEEHEKRYGWDAKPRSIYKRLYSDKTHFVYELIQNADDSGSDSIELQLKSNTLLVWNDGRQFTEEDVRNICSLGSSDKDLTDIGTFGIGFKAVYNYTEFPEIYSNDECFRIRDFIKPEGIDKITPEIVKLVDEGKTVFRLPFKNNLPQDDLEHLKNRLCDLSKERSLLFLRNLKKVEWKDERDAQTGFYSCDRRPYDEIQSVSENESVELVKLTSALNGSWQLSETFLVFAKTIHPPQGVIDRLLEQAEDDDERQRIQKSANELQPIEVAFKLQDDRITVMDNCVLFAYLPTQKETHLKFLIQARYQTTPARDNIAKPSENPWNRWLVEKTANFLPEILEHLKSGGLLEPAFFNVLPLKGEVENEFKPIDETLQKAMQEGPFVPTQDGRYARAENVFYPESTPLRKLVKSSGMYSDSSLLHPYIRKDAKESNRCFDLMAKAGVKEIKASDLLHWLEKQSLDWFKKKTNKWLCSLYIYFNRKWSKSELERIKELPLVRLENGEHVRVSDQLVYFPPETHRDREEIAYFLNELPVLRATLLKGKNRNDIADFLESIGVKELHPENLINKSICPLYRQSNKPAIMKNRRHVRYIFKSWQKATESDRSRLEENVSKVPILRAYKGIQRETSGFVVPCKGYLPQAYTSDNDLETYFSVYDDDLWFVDDKYLTNKSDTKVWLRFLKAIGAMHTPQIIDIEVSGSSEECEKRGITYEYSTKPFEDGKFKDVSRRAYEYFDGHIVDRNFDGLSEVLAQIDNHNEIYLPKALWELLVKLVSSLPSEEWQRNSFFTVSFQGVYRWFHQTDRSKSFDADFYRQLKKIAWIPDKQGNLHKPPECFAPTSENLELLGDSVFYLPDSFSTNTAAARWLSEKLGVHLNADVDSVLNYLQTMSQKEVGLEDVEPIYKFLESQDELLWGFEDEPFIFIPEPEPRWWRVDEVFWEDESPVFGDDCGYLKAHYSENLKSFFIHSLGIAEYADTLDYARGIQDIASKMQSGTKEIRDRVQELYRRLWLSLQKNEDSWEGEEQQEEWEQIREDACWIGKKGSEWDFFYLHELVWKDDDYRSELFKNDIPFWGFNDDLLELAKELGVKGCYTDSDIEFEYYGDQEEDLDKLVEVRDLRQNVRDFLHSPHLCGEHGEEKSTEILDRLSVRRVEKLEVRFKLKGWSVPDPNPRQSFLEVTGQEATLWLASEASEDQCAWLIGDALQDYFGDVKELSAFVEDLLTKDKGNVLTRWKQKGLQTNEKDYKENEEDLTAPVDDKLANEFDSTDADTTVDESDVGIPMDDEGGDSVADGVDESEIHFSNDAGNNFTDDGSEHGTPEINENPGIGNGDPNSAAEKSKNRPYTPRTSGPNRSSEPWKNTSSVESDVESHRESSSKETELPAEDTYTSPHARKEVEHAGMKHAHRYEKREGRSPKDVSSEKRGYDIHSTSPDGKNRCIEVKARDDYASVVLTSNEWSVAKHLKDNYFLYVVLNARTQPELYIIQNPTDAISTVQNVTYQVPLSEIMEHGIPV